METDNLKPEESNVVPETTGVDLTEHDVAVPAREPFVSGVEFSEAKEENLSVNMYRHSGLSSPDTTLEAASEAIRDFMSTVERDEDGKLQFRDEEQYNRYIMIQSMMSMIAPRYNGNEGVPFCMGNAIESTNPKDFIPGVKRTGDLPPFTAAKSAKTASTILQSVRNKRNTGNEITLFLPATGIYVTFVAPTEADYCNYEVELTMETSTVGFNTFGLMLTTASGVYLRSMIDFSLKYCVSTTLEIGDLSIPQALRYAVDARDYGILLWGPLIAKFPGGIPWNLIDASTNSVHETMLNLLRSIRTFNDRLTDEQRTFMVKHTKPYMVTEELLQSYKKAARPNSKELWDDSELGIRFYFKGCTLDQYFESVEAWVNETQHEIAAALGQYPTDKERMEHTSTIIETHRLTRYLHKVAAISTIDEEGNDVYIEDKEDEIKKVLSELSSDRTFVKRFESAIADFEEAGRRTGFGYMPRGVNEDVNPDGPMRGFVPLSPDKVFLTVSRVVYEVQRAIAQAYANAG